MHIQTERKTELKIKNENCALLGVLNTLALRQLTLTRHWEDGSIKVVWGSINIWKQSHMSCPADKYAIVQWGNKHVYVYVLLSCVKSAT